MKRFVLLIIISIFILKSYAQQNVGIGTTTPDASAVLDITSTSKGLLIPRMDSTQRVNIASPATGLLVYDTTSKNVWYFDGIQWVRTSIVHKIDDLIDGKSDNDGSEDGSSIFIGIDAGMNDDGTDNKNVGVGFQTMSFNITGNSNIANGYQALKSNTTGSRNVAIGSHSLCSNTTMSDLVAIGDSSLFANGSGSPTPFESVENTAIGKNTLKNNTLGGYNTAVGFNSMKANITGKSNTAIGRLALSANTSGSENVAIGSLALFEGQGGSKNCAIGNNALQDNEGNQNIALGYHALLFNTTGSSNIGIGYATHAFNTTQSFNIAIGDSTLYRNGYIASGDEASYNTAIGHHSMVENRTGAKNVAIGSEALKNDIIGMNNVAIGTGALMTNYNGSGNVGLGYNAGYNELGSNKLYIENSNSSTPLIYGDFANDTVKIYGTLGIKDEYSFPNTDGTSGQVMQTDGNGNISWQTMIGVTKLDDLSDAVQNNHNVFVGPFSGLVATGDHNTSLGSHALQGNTSGAMNVAIGDSTLNKNIDGTNNIAIGKNAIKNNLTGDDIIAIGNNALKSATGGGNIAVGHYAMENMINGGANSAFGNSALKSSGGDYNSAFGNNSLIHSFADRNSAFGTNSGYGLVSGNQNALFGTDVMFANKNGSNNSVFGDQAFRSDTIGSFNTIVGAQALYMSEAGYNNTSIGYRAGFNANGIGNVFIGHKAGYNETTGGHLYIANDSTSIPLIYGDFSAEELYFKDKVGIGLEKSNAQFTHDLTIASVDSLTVRLIGPTSIFGYGARLNFGDAHRVFIDEPADDHMRIHADRVGVSRIPITNKFEVEGDASKTTAGNWMANSDKRIKTNISEIQNSFEVMKKLRPVTFNYTDEWKKKHPSIQDKKYYNFIAQEYGELFPGAIQGSGEFLDNDEEEILQIDTYNAQIVTMQAVKDLIKENEELKAEVNELKAALHDLSVKVSVLISNNAVVNSND